MARGVFIKPAKEVLSGQTTVTTAGTAVLLHSGQPCLAVTVKALGGNTGIVYVGNDGSDDVSSSTGFELGAGDSVPLEVKNLNKVYVDAAVNGEGVSWILRKGAE